MSTILKKSVLAASISSALMISHLSANTLDLSKAVSTYAGQSEKIDLNSIKEQIPSSHLIVLKTNSVAELLASGNHQGGNITASAEQISLLQEAITIELNNFDFNATVITKTKILTPGLVVKASQSALEKIAKDPRVAKVLPLFDSELHIEESSDYIKATPVRTDGLADGSTQKVAVLDTGIDYTHKVFGGAGTLDAYEEAQSDPATVTWPQGQVKGGYDFIRNDADPIEHDVENAEGKSSHPDDTGHGTSVSHSVTGIAPEVELYV